MDHYNTNTDEIAGAERPQPDGKRAADGPAKVIEAYIISRFPLYASGGLNTQSSLFESSVIDSLGILDIVAYVETEFAITVDNEDVVPENFESVALLADFVARKQSGA